MTQKRKPVKVRETLERPVKICDILEQTDLFPPQLPAGVTRAFLDTGAGRGELLGVPESREETDRRLANLRASRRRRGRADPD